MVVLWRGAGQRIGGTSQGLLARGQAGAAALVIGLEAIRARDSLGEARVILVPRRQRRHAGVALSGSGLAQGGVEAGALVEDEALALVMRAADLLECEESDFPTLRGGRFIPPELHTIHRAHREKYIQNATRLTMGCGEGVDVLTFTGRRIKCVVTVDAARTADETVFVVILRAVESLRPDLQIAGISETG